MSERHPNSKRSHRPRPGNWRALVRNSRGATAIEYGLIAALIIITMLASLYGLADVTVGMWNSVSSKVQNAR